MRSFTLLKKFVSNNLNGRKTDKHPCPISLANFISYHVEIVHTTSIQFITNCELHIYTYLTISYFIILLISRSVVLFKIYTILRDFTFPKETYIAHFVKG